MSNKSFIILIAIILLATGGYFLSVQSHKPKEVTLGVHHANQGQDHITPGQSHKAYNSDPASSGPHRSDAQAPAQWGVYTQEVPAEIFVHNEEHGGVVITYNPATIPADQLKKLQALFVPPYSNKGFSPTKALVTPRAKDTHMIEVAAWTWTLNLDSYNETTLMNFYLQHQGQSPEAGAGPNTPPINQAAN